MADGRSNNGESNSQHRIDQHPSLASKSSGGTAVVEPKVTIHTAPPESRASALSGLDPNRSDDLTRIRGITRELAEKLNRIGISNFDQIADWSPTDVRSLSAALKLGHSIYRQAWIEQAAKLALKRSPAEFANNRGKNAPPAAPPTSAPLANSKRSISALVASAAAAIRARGHLRKSSGGMTEEANQASDAAKTSITIRALASPREISQSELDERTTSSFSKIASEVGLAAAKFQDRSEKVEADAAVQPKEQQVTPLNLEPPISAAEPILTATQEPMPGAEQGNEAPPVAGPETTDAEIEEVAAVPEPAIATIAEITPAPPDNLRLIQDMPDSVADRLSVLDVRYFSEIAAFDAEDVAVLSDDCNLGDRIYRECWLEQAAMLATGTLTKAADYRASGQSINLAPYPEPVLQRDPAAFASLRPPLVSPIRTAASNAQPAISSAVEPVPAPVAEPPSDSLPATSHSPAPQIVPPPIPVTADVQPAPPASDPDPVSTTTDDDDPDLETPEYEEAEVMIRPRPRSPLDTTASSIRQPDAATDSETSPPEPGSLSSKLTEDSDTFNSDEDDQAGYLSNVEEAAVEIVTARPSKQPPATPATRSAPEENAPQAGRPVEQRSVNRFLKALRGR